MKKWLALSEQSESKGFSLIEVLVFVTILSLFFVAAATVATVSLRGMKSNENKILATRYAEELVDWLSGEKETDWNVFSARSPNKYCFNADPISSTWPSSNSNGCNNSYTLKSIFKRELQLSAPVGVSGVDVTVTVSWIESGQTLKVPINTVFTRFE